MQKIQNALLFLRSHSMRVPLWIRLVIIGLSFAVPLYWAITFSGVYAWVALLQAGVGNNEYSVTLAYLASALFLLLPGLALILLLGQFFPELDPKDKKKTLL